MSNRFSDNYEAVRHELTIEKKLRWRFIEVLDQIRQLPQRLVEHKQMCPDCAYRLEQDVQKFLQIRLVQEMQTTQVLKSRLRP